MQDTLSVDGVPSLDDRSQPRVVVAWIAPALAALLGCFFYAAGNFGFLNVFDLRRQVQLLIGLILIAFTPLLAWRSEKWMRQPIWWLALVTLAGQILVRQGDSVFFLVDRVGSVFIVALLFSLSPLFRTRVLRVIIFICGVFSMMAIVQAIVIWFYPEVVRYFVLGYTTSTQAERVVIGHPLEYLGLITPGAIDVFGHPMPRFRSFASEPSVLVCGFLAPGLLALTFKGSIRYMAIPILIFAVALSGSGTIFLSLALGGAAWVLLRFVPRSYKIPAAGPIVLVFAWLWLLTVVDIQQMMIAMSNLLEPLDRIYPVFNKVKSGTDRLQPVADHVRHLPTYLLLGSPRQGSGLLLHMVMYAGAAGLVAAIVVSYRMCKAAVAAFRATRGRVRLASAMIYGMFVQIMFFSEFGWMTMSGFMLMALMYEHLTAVAERHHVVTRF
jgi:hypothetical protein